MNCAWVSSGSLSISQNCAPHSARHFGLPQTCSALDTPNFQGATMASLCSCTGLVGPVPKGRWQFSWTNRRYGRNLSLLIRIKLKMHSNEWNYPSSPRPQKVCPTQRAVKEMFIVAHDTDEDNTATHCIHNIRTYSRDSLGFSMAPIPSAHVTKYRVVPLLLTRWFCIQTVL